MSDNTKPVAWYAESQSGSRSYATKRDDLSYWINKGWAIHPLYAHPPAAPVPPVVTLPDAGDDPFWQQMGDTAALRPERGEEGAWLLHDNVHKDVGVGRAAKTTRTTPQPPEASDDPR